MVTVTLEDDRAVFTVEGTHKLWALRSRLEIPVAHIMSVDVRPDDVRGWWHGFRVLGTQMPGLLTAGTFYQHGEFVFWDVHDPANTVVVSLDHEHYRKLIVEVSDPAAAAAMIRAAIGARRA